MSYKKIPYFKGVVVGKRFVSNVSNEILIDIVLHELHGKPLRKGFVANYAIATKDATQYSIGQNVSVDITIEETRNELSADN